MKFINPLLLEVHPLNEELVPPMTPEEFEVLVSDLKQNGVEQPLKLLAGTNQVIDGKNRLKGSIKAKLNKVPVEDKEISEDDLPFYILSRPAVHRHFATGQKAALAAKFAKLFSERKQGGTFSTSAIREQGGTFSTLTELSGKSRQVAGKLFGINDRYVQIALNLMKLAPESFELLERGELTIKDAQAIIAKARVERSPEDLIPELRELVAKGKLAPGAAWHLSQLTHDEQSAISALFKDRGLAALDESSGRKLKMTITRITAKDKEEWRKLQKDLLALQEEKKLLEQKLAASRHQTNQCLAELEELKNRTDEAAGDRPEVVARISFLEEELNRYKDAEKILSERLQEKQDEMEDLREQFLDVRDQKEALEQKNEDLAARLRHIYELIRKSRRGRKRKDIFQKQIDAQNKRLARAKEQIRELRDEKEKLNEIIGQLSNRVINLAARREHMQAQSALRHLIGILRGPELKNLPDHILLHEGDVIGALELLNEAMEAMEDLIARVNVSTRKLFQKMEVVEHETCTQEAGGPSSAGNAS